MISAIESMVLEKDFLDLLSIKVPREAFETYLQLFQLPSLLVDRISNKYLELADQQQVIQDLLNA